MRQKVKFINPDNVDPDGLAEAQAVAGAGDLTLDGALISGGTYTGDYARQIGILSAGNDSGITFTITGTDADGNAQTEAVTGASAAPGTAESTSYFKTVSAITASGAAAGNVSAGTVDEFVTGTIPLNHYTNSPAMVSIEAITGTINITVQETFSKIHNTTDTIQWVDGPASLVDITAADSDELSSHATGTRLMCNSYTDTAQLNYIINSERI